jgi:hypothetical protein
MPAITVVSVCQATTALVLGTKASRVEEERERRNTEERDGTRGGPRWIDGEGEGTIRARIIEMETEGRDRRGEKRQVQN